ncbi:MAG: SRPBCC family protein [Agriterribacter sp.]
MSKNEPFVIERVLQAPLQKVWKAITDKDQMKEWYFDLAEFEPEVGFEFSFTAGAKDKPYLHLCKVIEVVMGKKLSYSWRYDGYEGNSVVTFELFPEGANTRLKLTHEGLETFPASNPDLAKHNFAEGWNAIIGKSLKEFVETGIIQKAVDIKVPVQKLWDLLVSTSFTNQWAAAFGEGVYIETSWQEGGETAWKDKTGDTGARGVIKVKKAPHDLIMQYYDDVNAKAGDPLGEYVEAYRIDGDGQSARLSITAGPLALKYISMHEPMWDAAVKKIKEYAEKVVGGK